MIDTRKQFQLQTGVFLKRPDVVTFDDCIIGSVMRLFNKCTYVYVIVMSREIENKQMIYVAKKLFKLMA